MKERFRKILFPTLLVSTMLYGGFISYNTIGSNTDSVLLEQNVEALSGNDVGAKCPKGCRNIGWGLNKILECDCNYDHFSSCDSWGC